MRSSTGLLFCGAIFGSALLAQPAQAQSNRCLTSECFREGRIRDFNIIDRGTLIVFVGQDRCAFKIEVDELACNLTFLPEVAFFDRREKRMDYLLRPRTPTEDALDNKYDGAVSGNPGSSTRRICTNSTTLALKTQGFADDIGDGLPPSEAPCRILSIDAVTDSELLELLVDEDLILPPPPVGIGDISRTEDRGAAPAVEAEPKGQSDEASE
jgi:hypothetical protein